MLLVDEPEELQRIQSALVAALPDGALRRSTLQFLLTIRGQANKYCVLMVHLCGRTFGLDQIIDISVRAPLLVKFPLRSFAINFSSIFLWANVSIPSSSALHNDPA